MIDLTQKEVHLYKILVTLFGKENVIPRVTVKTVCENLPDTASFFPKELEGVQVLFTVVNDDDAPKLVVEFAPEISEVVDVYALEREKKIVHLLNACQIRYISINDLDYQDLIKFNKHRDFLVQFFQEKCGIDSDGDEEE